MAALDVVKHARKHLGYVESANKDNFFGKWYGANHSPWCACFASWAVNAAGYGSLIAGAQTKKGFNSCGKGIAFFKAKKAWHPVTEAKVGDLAFFDWDHDGEQDHVGIVTAIDLKAKKVKTIEGNTSDKSHSNGGVVQEQWRNFTVIMGVGRPDYVGYDKAHPKTVAATPVTPTPKVTPNEEAI